MIRILKVNGLPTTTPSGKGVVFSNDGKSTQLYVETAAKDGFKRLVPNIDVSGPALIHANEVAQYSIVNPGDNTTYVVESTDGVVVYDSVTQTFTFVVTNLLLSYASFKVNGQTFTVEVLVGILNAPSIQYPVNGATNIPVTGVVVQSDAFTLSNPVDEDVHISTDWEISTDPDFTTIVASSYNDVVNLTSFPIPS